MRKINKTTCTWIFFPPKEVFIQSENIFSEYQSKQEIELKNVEITFGNEGGMFIKYKKDEYPFAGIPCLPIIQAVNIIKRAIICKLRALKNPFIFLLTYRFWEKELTEIAKVSLSRYYLKPQYYSHSVREIYRVLNLIYPKKFDLVNSICMILEFDNAYRFRVQAFLGNLNQYEFRSNPKKAILKELKFAAKEDNQEYLRKRWNYFEKMFKGLWFIPSFRMVIKKFAYYLSLEKIKMDKADLYWQFR